MKPKLKNTKTAQEAAPVVAVMLVIGVVVGLIIKVLEALF
jgi:uncharacterized membrane protein (DUF106 family)